MFEQWKPDPQCSKNALFQYNTTRHTWAYKNKKIKTSDSMNGFCTTQIDQAFFVVHLRTKVIPTRINISQHLYRPISQDKIICIANCRYYENMRTSSWTGLSENSGNLTFFTVICHSVALWVIHCHNSGHPRLISKLEIFYVQ